MSIITPNMSLTVWNSLTDTYNHSQLASNFIALDQHDHSPGSGTQINGATGIKDYSIPGSKMSSDFALSFTTGTIPGTAIQSASTGTGINGTQIEDNSVETKKLKGMPYCELTTTSTGLSASSTDTKFPFNSVVFDNGLSLDGTAMADATANAIYARRDGIYAVDLHFPADATGATGTTVGGKIFKNGSGGSILGTTTTTSQYGGNFLFISLSTVCKLAAGDYVNAYYRNFLGPNTGEFGTYNSTVRFSLSWLGYYS